MQINMLKCIFYEWTKTIEGTHACRTRVNTQTTNGASTHKKARTNDERRWIRNTCAQNIIIHSTIVDHRTLSTIFFFNILLLLLLWFSSCSSRARNTSSICVLWTVNMNVKHKTHKRTQNACEPRVERFRRNILNIETDLVEWPATQRSSKWTHERI